MKLRVKVQVQVVLERLETVMFIVRGFDDVTTENRRNACTCKDQKGRQRQDNMDLCTKRRRDDKRVVPTNLSRESSFKRSRSRDVLIFQIVTLRKRYSVSAGLPPTSTNFTKSYCGDGQGRQLQKVQVTHILTVDVSTDYGPPSLDSGSQ